MKFICELDQVSLSLTSAKKFPHFFHDFWKVLENSRRLHLYVNFVRTIDKLWSLKGKTLSHETEDMQCRTAAATLELPWVSVKVEAFLDFISFTTRQLVSKSLCIAWYLLQFFIYWSYKLGKKIWPLLLQESVNCHHWKTKRNLPFQCPQFLHGELRFL